MLTNNQLLYLSLNRYDHFIVGESALTSNGLMYGGNILCLYTPHKELDGITRSGVSLESNHFNGEQFCVEIDKDNRLWLPTAERALIDTINFIDKNYIEGPLIESLQTYLESHEDLSELYSVADFYNVQREIVDYWINEAREESSMSMG